MNRSLQGLGAFYLAITFHCHPLDCTAASTDLEESIRRVRTGTLTIQTTPGAEVRVEQLRHEFWFGAALANHMFRGREDSADAARYKAVFLENFNAAVTENALKWHSMEPRQGQVDYATVDAILAWTKEHGIPLRGHNVFWGIPNRVQPWLKTMDDETLRRTLKARAQDIARRYRGQFAEYDLNNEMLHANYYEERLGPDITREMALWMRQEDPQAVLYLNDYDILTGRRLEDYLVHIRRFLDQGVPFGGIGVQGHLHGDTFDPGALRNALDRLAQFQLPVQVTEFNFPGQRSKYYGQRGARLSPEEEEAKAKALADYYQICFAHPAVEGILMWGFWEGANWIPVSSLFRRDWSPTPAAHAYRDLVFGRWWTRWQGRADAQGRCEVRAFFGQHRVTADGQESIVQLKRKEPLAHVTLGSTKEKRVTFERTATEFKWSLAEFDSTLPTDWTPYEFLVLELRASSPQYFNLRLFNGEVARTARINPFAGAWIRAAVPLAYYKRSQQSGFDMASMGNKPRTSFWMGVGRPPGPLDNVTGISVQMSAPVDQPTLEIRSIALAKEDPGDAVLEGKPLVDEFGQWIPANWPGKAHTLDQLKRAWAEEEAILGQNVASQCEYGGFLNTKARASGFFRVEEVGGRWWFVDPHGHWFFSIGADCVTARSGTRTRGRENVYAALPPAELSAAGRGGGRDSQVSFYTWNLQRRFGADWPEKWLDLTFKRMDAWGFNTVANWSDQALGSAQRKPYVATLGRGWGLESGWMGLPDLYAADWESRVNEAAARQCAPLKDDPWLLGYFIANEPPWPGKELQLVDMILGGNVTATQKELKTFLETGDTPPRRVAFVHAAFGRMLEVISAAIRRHDPNHLNLGIRFGGKPADEIVRLARGFDVYSQNIYASAPDHQSLDAIYQLTGRPIVIGEFHIGTPGRGLSAGLVQAADQEQRGVAYRYYVEKAAAHPVVVGTHWFQWLDQPATGRMDGENYNIGFLDVTDRPYQRLVEAARLTHRRVLAVHAGEEPPIDQKARTH